MKKKILSTSMCIILVLSFFMIFLSNEISPVKATVLFSDSFESGGITNWTGNITSTNSAWYVNSSAAHSGGYGFYAYRPAWDGYNYLIYSIGSNQTTLYCRTYFNLLSGGTTNATYNPYINFRSFTDAGDSTSTGLYNNNGTYCIYSFNGTATVGWVANTTATISTNTWYCLELGVIYGASGTLTVKLDGVLVASLTISTAGWATPKVYVGDYHSSAGHGASEKVCFDDVAISTSAIGLTSADATKPTYSGLSSSTNTAGASCLFNATFTDETALGPNGQYIFETNNTGTWIAESAVNFTVTPVTITVTKTLNSTGGNVVSYRWNFTDNAGNSNTTGIQNITLTASDTTAPTFGAITGSTTVCGVSATYTCAVSDDTAVSGYIPSYNNNNSWVNGSWTSGGSGTVTFTHKNTYGANINVKFYANDTANNWASSSQYNFTLTADTYTVTLTGLTSVPLNTPVSVTIAVSRAGGVTVSSWTMDITNNGGLQFNDYADNTFTFSESTSVSHLFNVSSFYDADCGATVTPTCTGLLVAWQVDGGGGGGGGSTTTPTTPTDTDDIQDDTNLPSDTSETGSSLLPQNIWPYIAIAGVAIVGLLVVSGDSKPSIKKARKNLKKQGQFKPPKQKKKKSVF